MVTIIGLLTLLLYNSLLCSCFVLQPFTTFKVIYNGHLKRFHTKVMNKSQYVEVLFQTITQRCNNGVIRCFNTLLWSCWRF